MQIIKAIRVEYHDYLGETASAEWNATVLLLPESRMVDCTTYVRTNTLNLLFHVSKVRVQDLRNEL